MAFWLGCIVWGANLFIREILFHHKSLVSLGVNVTIAGTGESNRSISYNISFPGTLWNSDFQKQMLFFNYIFCCFRRSAGGTDRSTIRTVLENVIKRLLFLLGLITTITEITIVHNHNKNCPAMISRNSCLFLASFSLPCPLSHPFILYLGDFGIGVPVDDDHCLRVSVDDSYQL